MLTILVADDHAIVRRGLRAIFEQREGWCVCAEASNGREAVDLAAQHRPNIAILDMAMPELNGLEATRGIRRRSPGTEILIFTMVESTTLVREVLTAGARGFILKGEMDRFVIDAIEALAAHKPYFSTEIADEILDGYLHPTAAPAPVKQLLTDREREIAQLISESTSNKQISLKLGISVKTIETHRTALMRKIGAHSVADVVRYAIRNNLTSV